jgi:hypothetical protein
MIPRIIVCMFFVICASACVLARHPTAQPSPVETPTPTPTPTPIPTPSPTPDDRPLREGLKTMAENSRNVMSWSLTLIGASILAIVSTGYLRPMSRRMRFVYLLFIPGWVLLGWSLYYGDSIARRYTATAFMQARVKLLEIGQLMNGEFDSQLTFMNWGLGVFAIWLIIYIVWWVIADLPAKEKA